MDGAVVFITAPLRVRCSAFSTVERGRRATDMCERSAKRRNKREKSKTVGQLEHNFSVLYCVLFFPVFVVR